MQRLLSIFAIFIVLLATIPAAAQTANVNLGLTKFDPTMPLQIDSDSLAIDDAGGSAVLEGDVLVQQAGLRLKADKLVLLYTSDGAGLNSFTASGNVIIENDTTKIEAQSALYDIKTAKIQLEGDVVLKQGASVVSAQTVEIDLKTGSAQMRGRVRSIIDLGAQ